MVEFIPIDWFISYFIRYNSFLVLRNIKKKKERRKNPARIINTGIIARDLMKIHIYSTAKYIKYPRCVSTLVRLNVHTGARRIAFQFNIREILMKFIHSI